MAKGEKLLTGIFGDPIAHSLSPAMHNAAYAALKLNGLYVPFRVRRENLTDAVRAVPALGMAGVNVTLPHKFEAAKLMDQLSPAARLLGAVNCIVNRRGNLFGDNTDVRGLELDLRELGVVVKNESVMVIGAGGGAAAAIMASLKLGASQIVLVNRTYERAQVLSRRFARKRIKPYPLKALLDGELLGEQSLIINATSVATTGQRFPALAYGSTKPKCFFYDLSYSRDPTPFLKPALELARPCADGRGMLLQQGALAFRLFNRVSPPLEAMREALYSSLEKQG